MFYRSSLAAICHHIVVSWCLSSSAEFFVSLSETIQQSDVRCKEQRMDVVPIRLQLLLGYVEV